MNLPYNTRTSNLRKAATSEFSRTDNRGNPIQPCATQNYLHERTDDHTQKLACMIVVIISMHDCSGHQACSVEEYVSGENKSIYLQKNG